MLAKLTKFEEWLSNVFWYYYRWYWLIGVAAATFGLLLVVDNITASRDDFAVAVVYNYMEPVYSSQFPWTPAPVGDDLDELLLASNADYNGDGVTRYRVVNLPNKWFGKDGEEPVYRAFSGEFEYVVGEREILEYWQELGWLGEFTESGQSKQVLAKVSKTTPSIVYKEEE
jgi:hypothetical protein